MDQRVFTHELLDDRAYHMKVVLNKPTLHSTNLFRAHQSRQDSLRWLPMILAKISKSVYNFDSATYPIPTVLVLRSNLIIPLMKR